MRNLLKIKAGALTALLLGTAALPAAQTNLVQTMSINLSAYTQGPTVTNGAIVSSSINVSKIKTDDVIQLLGTATTNHFSSLARLRIVRPLPDGDTSILVRDGDLSVDVTGFFVFGTNDLAVVRGRVNTDTGIAKGTEYSMHQFRLRDASGNQTINGHFRVSGVAPVSLGSVVASQGQVLGEAYQYVARVAGTGDLNGVDAIFTGTISCTGRHLETVP